MSSVTYTAKRSLTTGHTVETVYTINLRLNALEPSKKVRRSEQLSLSAKSENLLWHNKRTWQATTAALRGDERALVREFLESVIGGEPFNFDEFGSANAPDRPVNVVLAGVFRETRVVRQGDGGRDDYFRFTFSMRES